MADQETRTPGGSRPQSRAKDGKDFKGGNGGSGRDSKPRQQRDRNDRSERSDKFDRKDRKTDNKDQKREKKPFVPWLGEERPKKGPILDLELYKGKQIYVEFVGGREIAGTLTGFDSLMNLVLEDVTEYIENNRTRKLGTLVARGPLLQSLYPVEGTETLSTSA